MEGNDIIDILSFEIVICRW